MKRLPYMVVLGALLLLGSAVIVRAQSTGDGVNVDLEVRGCNNNNFCEAGLGENLLSCPHDCHLTNGAGGGSVLFLQNYINFTIVPTTNSSTLTWQSQNNTLCDVKWGKTAEYSDGTLQNTTYVSQHTVYLYGLLPATNYFLLISCHDNNGYTESHTGQFTTLTAPDTTPPQNPTPVQGAVGTSAITLSWHNPPDTDFSSVRITRSTDRFHSDPFVGTLVYEGSNQSVIDTAVIPGVTYFYTIFARDIAGNFSSGSALLMPYHVVSVPIVSPPANPTIPPVYYPMFPPVHLVVPVPSHPPVYQVHQKEPPVVFTLKKTVTIDPQELTTISTPITSDASADGGYVEIHNSQGVIVGRFLFAYRKESGTYESVIPPLEHKGEYSVTIFGYKNQELVPLNQGILNVPYDAPLPTTGAQRQTGQEYILFGLVLLLCVYLARRILPL